MIYLALYLAALAFFLRIGPPTEVDDLPMAAACALAAPVTWWCIATAFNQFFN